MWSTKLHTLWDDENVSIVSSLSRITEEDAKSAAVVAKKDMFEAVCMPGILIVNKTLVFPRRSFTDLQEALLVRKYAMLNHLIVDEKILYEEYPYLKTRKVADQPHKRIRLVPGRQYEWWEIPASPLGAAACQKLGMQIKQEDVMVIICSSLQLPIPLYRVLKDYLY